MSLRILEKLCHAAEKESATTSHVSIKSYGETGWKQMCGRLLAPQNTPLLDGLTENHSKEHFIISANYYNLICSNKQIMKNVSVVKLLLFNILICILLFYIDIKFE